MRARCWTVGTAALLALGAALLGCDRGNSQSSSARPEGSTKPVAAAPAEWRVGAYLSLSGEDASLGIYTKEGIELAIDEVNAAGGVKGRPIKVLYEDDKSNPQEATNKVLQLIDRDKVVALLGEAASSRSKAGGIIANKKKVPMISPSSTSIDVTKVGPFVFRVCYTDDVQGQAGADFIIDKLGKKKIGLLFASDDIYSAGLAEEFKTEVKKRGGELVAEKSFLKKETNFTTYLNELKDNKPEIIYAPLYYNQMITIARQAKAVGMKGDMFAGGDGWDADELLTDAGEEMEGAYLTNLYAPDVPWPNSKAFRVSYNERFHREPSSLAATGYDAAKLLADAMKRARDDSPEALRQAIQDTKDFSGSTGAITIDAERNADKPVVIARVSGKKFVYFATVHDKSTPPPK